MREAVTAQVEAGFTAVKMNGCGRMTPVATRAEVRACLTRAETAREVLGEDRDFGRDFHGRVSPANARRLLPLLAEYAPMFVEEPVLSDYMQALPDLVNASNIPLALGERLFTRREFLAPLQAGVAVLQPDISHAGGISELRRIAALAEAYGAQLAPHCPLGPVALAASLQVAFTTPNFLIQEQSLGIQGGGGRGRRTGGGRPRARLAEPGVALRGRGVRRVVTRSPARPGPAGRPAPDRSAAPGGPAPPPPPRAPRPE